MEVFSTLADAFAKIMRLLEEIKEKLDRPVEDPDKVWYDNQEVMEFLKISPRTLITYRQKGILKFSQIGSKIYYRKSDVQEMLENHDRSTRKQ
jgi:hypothetical protein